MSGVFYLTVFCEQNTGARNVQGGVHTKSVQIINEGEYMTAYQDTIKDNSVQVIGYEQDLVVYAIDNWKREIVTRYRALTEWLSWGLWQ